ncbi:MAG: flagellar motor protein MotB [Phycisphaerae bacterium]
MIPTEKSALLLALVLVGSAIGCTGPQKKRITLLEAANQNLTTRLNLTSEELEKTRADQRYLDRRLVAALNEAQDLRERLEAEPVPVEAAPGWTAVPGGAMIALEDRVLFAPGNTAIRKEARRALDAVASVLQSEYADKDVLILGHTDDQPIKKSGWTDNLQLSTERALSVVRYLNAHGIAAKRLIAAGSGQSRPRASGKSEASRASNRRVEIFALPPLPPAAQP